MERKLFKKLFSMLLVLAMVLSMCPTFVFAEGTTDYSDYTYVAFGDSITYGIDGDYSSGEEGYRMEKPYPTLVAENLGIGTVVNQAKSGATWTQHASRTNMTERIMRYNGDADIISVMLGVNDYAAKCALGDMNSRDNTTIYGSIHMAAKHLTTAYPNAFIFFMTPFKYKTEDNGKYTLSDVAQAVKEVAAVYDIPVLDMYTNGQFDPATGAKDQIHPTQAHHINYTAPMICEFIKQYNAPASKDACPCDTCKGADAVWENWDGTAAFVNGKHYRVSKDVQLTGVISIPKGTTVVLDLNGKTITAATDSRCFAISGELVIVNSTADKDADGNYTGMITGGSASAKDVNGDQRGGNIVIENGTSASAPGGTLKLYGGTIANGTAPNAGGNLKVGKYTKFYMYGGAIVDGRSESTSSGVGNGGNMNVDAGSTFEMRGGEISGGVASFSGGNIYNYRGTITLYGGIITGGKANATGSNRGGGNIWLNSTNAKLILKGGLISDGESKRFGGNILVDNASGKITVEGGAITGGKAAVSGGSIYITKGQLEMTGGVLSGGKANWDFTNNEQSTGGNDGGNLYITDSGAKAYLGGNAVVTGGNAGTGGYGGNIYMTSSAELYLYGNAQVTFGEGYGGKNIYAMTTPKVVMYGGTVKNGTFNTYTSGSFHMYGGQIEDLRWASSGTQETVIYNGIVGSNTSGLPEKLDIWAADCATVTQTTHLEGHTIYAIYQTSLTNGACTTCGHTYSAANCGTCKYAHPAVKVANCEFCNEGAVWAPLLGNELVADHYYLPADVTLADKIGLAVGDGVCIDLNGHNLTTADVSSGITMTSAKLNITNTGADASAIISGGGGILTANMASGQCRSTVNFKNVMITGGHSRDNGGNISTNGVNLVLDNCAISGGYAPKNGGNVCCYATNLTIKGNTRITGGFAGNNGDDLYLGTTSKVQMYSGAVGDVCQLNSTGSFHLYDGALDAIRVYNYTNSTSSYNASFFMYGGRTGGISFPGTSSATGSGKVVVYAGTTGFDPRTSNRGNATMLAPCSCVTQNADGTYTTIHTEGSTTCEVCAANDVYAGGYTYPDAFVGQHNYPENWTEGKKECENCGNILGCEHANTTLIGYQAATCLAPGYTGDYVCDECGTVTVAGTSIDQKTHEYGDDDICDNGCDNTKCVNNGHALTKTDAAEDTCTAIGNSEYWTCGTCGKFFSDANGETEIEKDSWIINEIIDHTYTYNNIGEGIHEILCEKCDYHGTADCADENGDHFCDRCGDKLLDPVASVNGEEYGSLMEAWQNATPNATITLLADVDMTGIEGMYVPSSTLTLDLNGKTLEIPFQAITFAGEGFTIKNGTIDSLGASYGLWIGGYAEAAAASNVTIEDVTIIGGINIKNATNVTLNNVTATGIGYYAVWVEGNASDVVINSGSYTGAEGKAAVAAAVTDALAVKGGTYSSNVSAFCEEGKHTAPNEGVYVYGEHSYNAVVTDPTCTEKGYTTYTCTCGDEYIDNEVAENGHSHASEYHAATETENAYTVYTCHCGDTYTIVEEGTMLHFAINETTGESYATLQEALNATAKGQTVKLLKDVEAEDIYVGSGKTLDLNGKKLTINSTISASFTTTHIVDSSKGEGSLILAEGSEVALNSKNKQLPVWTSEGVKFVEIAYKQIAETVDGDAEALKYKFYFNVADDSILPQLIAGNTDSLTIRVKVNYTTASGMHAYQYFELNEDLMNKYVAKWPDGMVELTIRGTDGLQSLTFTAEIVSTAPNGASVVIGSVPLSA